jgi:hypothetical protein
MPKPYVKESRPELNGTTFFFMLQDPANSTSIDFKDAKRIDAASH